MAVSTVATISRQVYGENLLGCSEGTDAQQVVDARTLRSVPDQDLFAAEWRTRVDLSAGNINIPATCIHPTELSAPLNTSAFYPQHITWPPSTVSTKLAQMISRYESEMPGNWSFTSQTLFVEPPLHWICRHVCQESPTDILYSISDQREIAELHWQDVPCIQTCFNDLQYFLKLENSGTFLHLQTDPQPCLCGEDLQLPAAIHTKQLLWIRCSAFASAWIRSDLAVVMHFVKHISCRWDEVTASRLLKVDQVSCCSPNMLTYQNFCF